VSAGAAFADSLAVTTTQPTVDGVVKAGEYSYSKDAQQLTLYVNRTADALSVAVVGKTAGWVAFGLGSLRMDGATIFMGYVQPDGTVQLKPQAGQGHSHRDTTKDVQDTILASAMTESSGVTTLEVTLRPDTYVKSGQSVLDLIYAEGSDDSFQPKHMFRGTLELTLSK
jgi:hypothetical protein